MQRRPSHSFVRVSGFGFRVSGFGFRVTQTSRSVDSPLDSVEEARVFRSSFLSRSHVFLRVDPVCLVSWQRLLGPKGIQSRAECLECSFMPKAHETQAHFHPTSLVGNHAGDKAADHARCELRVRRGGWGGAEQETEGTGRS